MFISGTPYTGTFSEMIAYVDSIKGTLGATVYLPAGTYDGTGLTFPRSLNMHGVPHLTEITGKPTIVTNTLTGGIYQGLNFVDGFTMNSCRNLDVRSCYIGGNVDLIGPSYYNNFYNCTWVLADGVTGVTTHSNEQNCNHVTGCRMYYITAGFRLLGDEGELAPRGWTIRDTSIEGSGPTDQVLGAGIQADGIGHVFDGLWLERGASRTYSSLGTIWLGPNSHHCRVGVGRFSFLDTVVDYGTNNLIENQAGYETITDNGDHVIYRFD